MAPPTGIPGAHESRQGRGAAARGRVPAVERAAMVLRAVSESDHALSFGELAERVPLARSSLHDMCFSLVETGFLERTPSGRYVIGIKVIELSRKRLNSMEIVSSFRDAVESMKAIPETIVLSVLAGADVVYVSFVDGHRPLAVKYQIGMRLPAAFTASGKAILATMEPEQVSKLLPAHLTNLYGRQAEKTLDDLLAELEATRQRGYSIDDEETAIGMTCIGAPVFTADQAEAVGAVAVSLVKSAQNWFDPKIGYYVQDVASVMSRRLGAVRSFGGASGTGL